MEIISYYFNIMENINMEIRKLLSGKYEYGLYGGSSWMCIEYNILGRGTLFKTNYFYKLVEIYREFKRQIHHMQNSTVSGSADTCFSRWPQNKVFQEFETNFVSSQESTRLPHHKQKLPRSCDLRKHWEILGFKKKSADEVLFSLI